MLLEKGADPNAVYNCNDPRKGLRYAGRKFPEEKSNCMEPDHPSGAGKCYHSADFNSSPGIDPCLVIAVKKRDEELFRFSIEGTDRIFRILALSESMNQQDGHFAHILLAEYKTPPEVSVRSDEEMIFWFRRLRQPLFQAIKNNNLSLVQLLVQYRANVNISFSFYGEIELDHYPSPREDRLPEGSALQLAIKLGNPEIIDFLRSHGAVEMVELVD
ncbi:hypothetical protein N7495_001340 [Penicillium taxi]|uniref:uncharacterized protein n=1 Tax=Penicillium taxi TaxID=168475 RepID=UPI002544E47E|nr:uncharacterized protein N7495_001340 [Penicillium taxi]KAJ5908658.1 hypothetical protein N7495_001340 [Penicillium taxi]